MAEFNWVAFIEFQTPGVVHDLQLLNRTEPWFLLFMCFFGGSYNKVLLFQLDITGWLYKQLLIYQRTFFE